MYIVDSFIFDDVVKQNRWNGSNRLSKGMAFRKMKNVAFEEYRNPDQTISFAYWMEKK